MEVKVNKGIDNVGYSIHDSDDAFRVEFDISRKLKIQGAYKLSEDFVTPQLK
jgi:hypothetical protein